MSVFLTGCLSISLSLCLSVYLSVCLSLCLFSCMSVSLSVCLTFCLSLRLSISLSLYLYVRPFICLSHVCLSVCLPVYWLATQGSYKYKAATEEIAWQDGRRARWLVLFIVVNMSYQPSSLGSFWVSADGYELQMKGNSQNSRSYANFEAVAAIALLALALAAALALGLALWPISAEPTTKINQNKAEPMQRRQR